MDGLFNLSSLSGLFALTLNVVCRSLYFGGLSLSLKLLLSEDNLQGKQKSIIKQYIGYLVDNNKVIPLQLQFQNGF